MKPENFKTLTFGTGRYLVLAPNLFAHEVHFKSCSWWRIYHGIMSIGSEWPVSILALRDEDGKVLRFESLQECCDYVATLAKKS